MEYVTPGEPTIQEEQSNEPPPPPSNKADNLNENITSYCRKAKVTTCSKPIHCLEQIVERTTESSQKNTEYYPQPGEHSYPKVNEKGTLLDQKDTLQI